MKKKIVLGKRRRVCPATGKVRYATEAKAAQILDRTGRLPRSKFRHGRPSRSYACRYCGGWHLTSKPFQPVQGAS